MKKIDWENTIVDEKFHPRCRDGARALHIGDGFEPYACLLRSGMSVEEAVEEFVTTYNYRYPDDPDNEEKLRDLITITEYVRRGREWIEI